MNRILAVSKYLIKDMSKAMLVFYAVIITLSTIMVGSFVAINNNSSGNVSFGGFGFSAVIFLFIAAMNSFKVNFKFMLANNVTRKSFFAAALLGLGGMAAVMSLLDFISDRILKTMIPYVGLFEGLYKNNSLAANLLWTFALLLFAACWGWLITILYYWCSKLMKTVISILPVLIVILLGILNERVGGAISTAVVRFLTVSLGFVDYNAYIAVLSFMIGSLILGGLSYLLIRRMPIKD